MKRTEKRWAELAWDDRKGYCPGRIFDAGMTKDAICKKEGLHPSQLIRLTIPYEVKDA